jgi:DNA-binding GntR family transcriptional regulator
MTAPVIHSLREQIREHILEGIISGRWQPGERIVERRIATELEVSQTPVREALRELESLRLIESAPNKGVRVRSLTAADLEESYPVRAGLEAIAAELAADRLAEDCSALEPHVNALYEADRTSDGTAQVRHTVAFHREMVRAAGNSVLLHTWEGLGIEVFTALSIRWLGTQPPSSAGIPGSPSSSRPMCWAARLGTRASSPRGFGPDRTGSATLSVRGGFRHAHLRVPHTAPAQER